MGPGYCLDAMDGAFPGCPCEAMPVCLLGLPLVE